MTRAWQVATGNNAPLTLNTPPAQVDLASASYLRILGGTADDALTTDGAGNLVFRPVTGGGPGGGIPEAPADGQAYLRRGAPGSWVTVIDGGTF
jgi:hypothetical protein